MNNILIFIFVFLSSIGAENQYLWPINNNNNAITAVFGDERSRRFHAGIDVRTYGVIGQEIYAIESGYISRIKISPTGYGKTIYLQLDDGNTALYAHLDKFNYKIEEKVKLIQKKNNSNFIDNYISKNELYFNKGDIVGYSGDTGSLSGPHLHFEIRDKDGNPINPLKNYYSIEDTLKPIANSLALIPLDKSCWINGIQDYNIFELTKINEYKYVLVDTISVIGNFGLAINTKDKINKQNFNFGIYKIELLIDNKLKYKLNFDKYNFNQDHLVYQELDFHLLNKLDKKYHKLFNNQNIELDFIDSQSSKGINLDQDYHNLIINISDINQNIIQVQGVLKGDIIINPEITYNKLNSEIFSKSGFDNLVLNYTTRYNESKLIPASYTMIDSQYIKLDVQKPPYEIIEYYFQNNNGLKSKVNYFETENFDPLRIKGNIAFKHLENGIIVEFIENIYSGYNASLIINYNNNLSKKIELYRKTKNKISTGILNIQDFKDAKELIINYNNNLDITFKKNINGKIFYSKNNKNFMKHNDFTVYSNKNSLYNDVFVEISDTNIIIDEVFEIIAKPIKLIPNNIPFNNHLTLIYENNINEISGGSIYNYNINKEEWIHMENINYNDSINPSKIKTKIYSGGIFALLNETNGPTISNISPANDSIYKSKDLNEISFKIIDEYSKINYDSIEVKIDNESLNYEYIPYRDMVRCNIINKLIQGYHTFEIFAQDRLGNASIKKGTFLIE